jgi:hypothetical protein
MEATTHATASSALPSVKRTAAASGMNELGTSQYGIRNDVTTIMYPSNPVTRAVSDLSYFYRESATSLNPFVSGLASVMICYFFLCD